ncbi:MAG: peptide-methionine (R)-S-oxide reductase MsrB [Phycisphaeraceae bacterium]
MHPLVLPCLVFVLLLAGCARDSTPYTEQTAEIDPAMNDADNNPTTPPAEDEKVELSDAQWREILSDEEFYVLRRSGTERPGTGRYLDQGKEDKGAYHCVGCGNHLYDAKHKFHSGCGWPSFNQEVRKGAITEHRDTSHNMVRLEMRCARCDGHLGHIFEDGFDQPTGLRHCVNGVALIFVPEGEDPQAVIKAHREKYANR